LEPLNKTDFPPAASTQLPFLSFPVREAEEEEEEE
jgi:hypothetical protein